MYSAIFTLWQICVFRKGPEQLPAATQILALTILLLILVEGLSIPITPMGVSILTWAAILVTQFILVAAFAYALLRFRKTPNRLFQTLSAWYGTDAILAAFMLIAVSLIPQVGIVGILVVVLFGWQVAIHGFILHRSLTTSFVAGIGIAFALHLVIGILLTTIFDIQISNPLVDSAESPPS